MFELVAFQSEESSVDSHDLLYFRRNQNFHDILRGLNLGQQGVFDISNHFHHLFWFGDLNYRVHTLQIEVCSKVCFEKMIYSTVNLRISAWALI